MKKILLVDDDRALAPLLAEYLEGKNFRVTLAQTGDDGLAAFKKQPFDLCLLDVKMPFKDGFSLAADLRAIDPQIPFIFLTGQNQKEDRIRGLTLGADDYVTKPFSIEEVYLRVEAVLRRTGRQQAERAGEEPRQIGRYRFDPVSRELFFDGKNAARLSAIEAKLLDLFCLSPTGVVERDTALNRVWGDDFNAHSRSLNVYVSKLRQFLKDDPAIEILNIHGEGYRLVVR